MWNIGAAALNDSLLVYLIGLLCVTCTDLAVLAGSNYTESCFSKYGGHPVKSDFTHEVALRLVLSTIASSAARYKRHIVPLVSLSIDYYLRVFVRVYSSAAEVKMAARYANRNHAVSMQLFWKLSSFLTWMFSSNSKTMLAYVCCGCQSTWTQPLGKATVGAKGHKKFQVNTGPPVDRHCEFCGSKFHVRRAVPTFALDKWIEQMHIHQR